MNMNFHAKNMKRQTRSILVQLRIMTITQILMGVCKQKSHCCTVLGYKIDFCVEKVYSCVMSIVKLFQLRLYLTYVVSNAHMLQKFSLVAYNHEVGCSFQPTFTSRQR